MGISATELGRSPGQAQPKHPKARSSPAGLRPRSHFDRLRTGQDGGRLLRRSSCSWSSPRIFAPVDLQAAQHLPDGRDDPLRARATCSDFNTGLPLQGPPNHGFWAAHPLGLAPPDRRRQPRPAPLRPAHVAPRSPPSPRCSASDRRRARPGRRLLARLARPDHHVRHRPVPVVPVPARRPRDGADHRRALRQGDDLARLCQGRSSSP